MKNKKLCIFGSGGFAKEVLLLAKDCGIDIECFIDFEEKAMMGYPVLQEDLDNFDFPRFDVVVAIGSPSLRKKITTKLQSKNATFTTLIHPTARIMGLGYSFANVKVGQGTVICANCILTGDIVLGDFSQLNLSTTIGHDVVTSEYFTTAPGVHINGNNKIGSEVYFGSNASTVENIKIVDKVTVGAGACVTKDIVESGTYVGLPAKKMERKNG